jgi:hypothetical protein
VELFTAEGVSLRNTAGDGRGRYRLDALGPGLVTLAVAAPGLGAAAAVVRIEAGVEVVKDLILGPECGAVEGQVTAAERIASAPPLPQTGVTCLDGRGLAVGLVLSGSDGWYRTVDLAPGLYTLIFFHDGYARAARRVQVSAGNATRLDVVLGTGYGRVEGRITDALTSSGLVAGVVVTGATGAVVAMTASDRDGYYDLDYLFGRLVFRFGADDYTPAIREVVVEADDEIRLDIALARLAAMKVASVEAKLSEVSGELIGPGTVEVTGKLALDVLYVPRDVDEVYFVHHKENWTHEVKVRRLARPTSVEVEAATRGATGRVTPTGLIEVAVSIWIKVWVGGCPSEETCLAIVIVDPGR